VNPIEQLIQMLFGGMATPASAPTMTPAMLAQLGLTPGSPAGGSNPGVITKLGGLLDPSNPMAGLLKLISGASMLPFASQGEGAINQGMSLLQNPAAFMGLVKRLAQPLNKQLVRTVQQGAQGSAAEAGLGQASGAIASGTAKALAPYEESNLQNAQGTALQQIQEMLAGSNLFGSPYAKIAQMFTGAGGSPGGSLF
jgi:hypothetical protein